MSIEEAGVSLTIQYNVEDTMEDLRRLQAVAYRGLGLMRRFGLPENIDEAASKIMRFIALVNELRLALVALQAARMASGDPIAWLQFGVTAGFLVFDLGDFMMEAF